MLNKYASIIPDVNIEKQLDYSIPEHLQNKIKIGSLVEIQLRGQIIKGYVHKIKEKADIEKILPINNVIDAPISDNLLELANWMAQYYCCSLYKVFKCMIPSAMREEIKPKTDVFLSLAKSKKEIAILCSSLKINPAQIKILHEMLKHKKGIFLKELLEKTNVSKSPIDSLITKQIIKATEIVKSKEELILDEEFFPTTAKILNEEQQLCMNSIISSLQSALFKPHLLFGITSSGKTEIYLQAIQKTLDLKKNAIMLVPEIALTPQTIERFKARFSQETIAVIHHKINPKEKQQAWHDIKEGKVNIVIGARSAIFSPLPNIGLIIIDEEHDNSYKQTEEAPTYHAKHIAIMRAKLESCTVILGSATPSLESYYNATDGKYELNILKTRANAASLPKITIIDMKKERDKNSKNGYLFSDPLLTGIKERFEKGEQTLLFLNRRGYNSLLICKSCAKTYKCEHCDIALTFHKEKHILICHSCGYKKTPTKICPFCHEEESIEYRGFGTEQIERSLNIIFPKIRTLRVDRDTTYSKNSHETLFQQFRSGKADVLIGTQMIVKGLHFPSVTLVGVLNTDAALNIPDFRSSEMVFQLLTQVAGRSGRSSLKGEVIIQTNLVDNATILMAKEQDYPSFYKMEIENRKLFEYPPFCKMIKIVFSGANEATTIDTAAMFRNNLIKLLPKNCKIHPVISSGHIKLKDYFRFQFLIRGNSSAIQKAIFQLKTTLSLPTSIKILIDVDPISTYF
jgi:primosomal protein N' (replication factor Y)